MFGQIKFEEFEGLTKMPQEAASAWSAFEGAGIVGASYKPILYVGLQEVKGTNYIFIAEQTLMTADQDKHLVTVKINNFEGEYSIGIDSFKVIF